MVLKFALTPMLRPSEDLGTLDPDSFEFNGPVWGAGAANMSLPIHGKRDEAQALKARTTPDGVEVYISEDGTYVWCGWIEYRSRVPNSPKLEVRMSSWKAWFYTRLVDATALFYPDTWDEYDIVRNLLSRAAGTSDNAKGSPRFKITSEKSGIKRQLTVQPWTSYGDVLDSLASRDGGFEWDVVAKPATDYDGPELWVELYRQGDRRNPFQLLMLDSSQSTNQIAVGAISEDATQRASRVWATGAGTAGLDQVWSYDEDPELNSGLTLLREVKDDYSSVTRKATLYDHARAGRALRKAPMNSINVDLQYDKVDIRTYGAGDRARFRLSDNWESIDIDGARIVDRAVRKTEDGVLMVTVVLDLLDVRGF